LRNSEFTLEQVSATPSQLPPPTLPEMSVIGRSNVGKSSLVNRVLGSKNLLRVSRTPGRTQAVFFIRIGDRGFLVDLPGYGYAKAPHAVRRQWGKLVDAYLARKADGRALLLMDIRRSPSDQDLQMVNWFRYYGRKFSVVLTKADKIARGKRMQAACAVSRALELGSEDPPIPFSAERGEGLEKVRKLIYGTFDAT
jgi:GTP-binding protein